MATLQPFTYSRMGNEYWPLWPVGGDAMRLGTIGMAHFVDKRVGKGKIVPFLVSNRYRT